MDQTPLGSHLGPAHRQHQQLCKHYNTARGCFRGDSCRYRHLDTPGAAPKPAPTPCDIPCRFFAAGYCNRGDSCFFKHHSEPSSFDASGPTKEASLPTAPRNDQEEGEDGYACAICFEEKPTSYGLLEGCSHSFCLECIRTWRAAGDKDHSVIMSGVIKTCPACRAPSSFITPSTKFYPSGHPMKIRTIDGYKANLAKIPCKYFAKRHGPNRYCPFGRDCFYQHQNTDGTPYVFEHGAEEMRAAQQRRNARRARAADFAWFQDTLNSIADNLINSNFDAFMASMGDFDDLDDEEEDEHDEGEGEGEGGDEDEDEVDDEDEEDDDWDDDDEDDLQRALQNQWMSERVLREFLRRQHLDEPSESNANSDGPPLDCPHAADTEPSIAPGFVPASTVPRRQNHRRRH